jgi:N6-adenosine-specific RNA methylase IME4
MNKFASIVMDPPWQYSNKKTGGKTNGVMNSGASQKYPTIPLKEILDFNLDDISADDSTMFLWCTSPLLQWGIRCLERWGFRYRFSIYWVKLDPQITVTKNGSELIWRGKRGMGFWLSNQVEICLIGTKGHVAPWYDRTPNVIFSVPGKHSEKPVEFWDLIESHAPMERVEAFARVPRDGWNRWGNQVHSTVDLSSIFLK